MIPRIKDYRLIIGFLLAHLLLFISFYDEAIFWYMFTASYLILISYAIVHVELDDESAFFSYAGLGIISGVLLFALFWFGQKGLDFLHFPYRSSMNDLYKWFSPSMFWHYLALILIAVPGEEIFWRGFVQKRILKYTSVKLGIVLSAVMYASVHLYSGQWLLMFAALVAGLFWGGLYTWKRSMPLVIVSHLLFDLLLFVFMPLN
jgi:uncharacterized protein